jgi:hypothetical protein
VRAPRVEVEASIKHVQAVVVGAVPEVDDLPVAVHTIEAEQDLDRVLGALDDTRRGE